MALTGDGLLINADGTQVVQIKSSTGQEPAVFGMSGDGVGNTNGLSTAAIQHAYNGASFDRWRNNTQGTLLASAARTSSSGTAEQTNYNARGVMLFLNITANPGGAETLIVQVRSADPVSGSNINSIVSFPATTAATNGIYRYQIYPNAVETISMTNFDVQGIALPRSWSVLVFHSGAGSWTYSLGYSLIV